MRCSQCEKMVSYDEPQAEVQSESVDEDGQVSIEVRLVLPCAECGNELKETTFSFEHSLDHTCEVGKVLCECEHPFSEHPQTSSENEEFGMKCRHGMELKLSEDQEVPGNKEFVKPCECEKFKDPEESGFELEVSDPEPLDDYKPKTNSKGKPVPMRYQKHFFGVTVSGTATCNKCGEAIEFELSDEIQSSAMDKI